MTSAWQRTTLADFCKRAGLDATEEYFLQSIIRLADAKGIMSDNALAIRTAAFTIPWASSMYEAYRAGHLRKDHMRKALESALKASENLQPYRRFLPTVAAWRLQISAALSQSTRSPSLSFNILPSDVEDHRKEILSLLLAEPGRPSFTYEELDLLAAEVAVGYILRAANISEPFSSCDLAGL